MKHATENACEYVAVREFSIELLKEKRGEVT